MSKEYKELLIKWHELCLEAQLYFRLSLNMGADTRGPAPRSVPLEMRKLELANALISN